VAREISKLHEECRRGTLSELVAHFTSTPPRGEIVIVVAGCDAPSHKHQREQED
jgi:16S rRNA (cytidine1402-2'-O)-methyltransferase